MHERRLGQGRQKLIEPIRVARNEARLPNPLSRFLDPGFGQTRPLMLKMKTPARSMGRTARKPAGLVEPVHDFLMPLGLPCNPVMTAKPTKVPGTL